MRELRSVRQTVEPLAVDAAFDGDPRRWLEERAAQLKLSWLLAHADDGVIWGTLSGGTLRTSSTVFPSVSPPLRTVTLQQVRLFGETGELLVWRDVSGWRARSVIDSAGDEDEVFDERYLLWGTHVEEARDGFSLLREGAEGLRHAPPIDVHTLDGSRLSGRLGLTVRHSIRYDDDGQAGIALSRLVALVLPDSAAEGGI